MLIRFEAVGRKVLRGRTIQMVCVSEVEAKKTADRLNAVADKMDKEQRKKLNEAGK
jgi:hypothetical protein